MHLVTAINKGDIDAVKTLLDKGADINKGGSFFSQNLPLVEAVSTGNVKITELLLDRGADMYLENNYGKNAINTAVNEENEEILQLLIKHGADLTKDKDLLISAANYNKSLNILRLLLNKGLDINQKSDSIAPLLVTSYRNDLNYSNDIMKFLLENGADVNTKNVNGMTPLMFAAYRHNIEGVKIMLKFGADINAVDNSMYNTLTYATENKNIENQLETIKILLENGVNPFVKTYGGILPETEKLLAEYRWKRLYERDKDTARRYALNFTNEEGTPFIPKDIWEIILLNKRREQLCRNLNSDKNLEILKLFALEFGIPITENMNKGKICGLLSRYIVYGKNTKPLERVEREEAELKNKVREIAYKMGLNPEDSLSSLLTQLGKIF